MELTNELNFVTHFRSRETHYIEYLLPVEKYLFLRLLALRS